MSTIIEGDFEWDEEKASANLLKHGVSFAEAATVFADDGSGTDRVAVIGASLRDRIFDVVHVERGERDRIVSARVATRPERTLYESRGEK